MIIICRRRGDSLIIFNIDVLFYINYNKVYVILRGF